MISFKRSARTAISALLLSSAVVALATTTAGAEGSTSTPTVSAATSDASSSTSAAPSGEAMPVGNLPGWKQIFTDDFTTSVPLGSFPANVSSKWGAYPSTWTDTSGNGHYSPGIVSVGGGLLNSNIHTENGVALVSALTPKLPAAMVYGRYAVRFRFDPLPGYKMAWMLWPDSNNSGVEGELDFPEMNLDSSTAWAFAHRTNSTGPEDQAWFKAALTPGTWHTAVIEWTKDLVVYQYDGVELGRSSVRTPSTPMHWVLQTETSLTSGTAPDPSVHGNVQVDWVSAWAYDATTADTEHPVVTTIAPAASATLNGTTTLAASATDNVAVVGVQFKVDDKNVGAELTTAPYTIPWNSTLATDGNHIVSVVARDFAGLTTTKSVTAKVSNTPGDVKKPTVTTSVPLSNTTLFPVGAPLNVQFSEPVTGADSGSITLVNAKTGTAVAATVTYKVTNNQSIATLKPTSPLTEGTRYTVSLSSAIEDRSHNTLDPYSWSFATGPGPTATATSPAPLATNVSRSTKVVATADKALSRVSFTTVLLTSSAGVKVSATVGFDTATNRVTLTPKAPLAARTTYTVSLTNGIKDSAGNALKPLSWTFTTGA